MNEIRMIDNPNDKEAIAESILRDLPEWFGIESALAEYIKHSRHSIFYAAFEGNKPVGFIGINENFATSAEIYVMGILKDYHRKGIGGMLVERAEIDLKERGFRLFEVKTLSDSSPDVNYKKTRSFYSKMGFLPLDEQKELWDAHNPCLIMVKAI